MATSILYHAFGLKGVHREATQYIPDSIVNTIKTLKRQAYGFRDMVYFKLRLYHLHTQRYSLSG